MVMVLCKYYYDFSKNTHEILVEYYDEGTNSTSGFSGYHYEGKSFNNIDFPEPSGVLAYTPGVGPLWSATHDFQDGDWEWGLANTGLAVSDVFLVRSIFRGITKGGLKAATMGNKPWSHREFWNPSNSYSGFYHSSGFAAKGQHIHHGLLMQNLGIGKYTPNFIKHQMFGLKPIKGRWIKGKYYNSAEMHRAIHGKNKELTLSLFHRYFYGTPNWVYPFGISVTGRGIDSIYNNE